ncbi:MULTISPECIES: glycosyltransferase family 39 protein [Myxococcaceae]|uniref:glycosyltransferase family 39 protein n=1 Tax=Myxococcaceae TaxID=31 RepID=UPI00188DCBFE|nr:glycosyltransferase family 39 protein [Simulacricoccus sp. 17bor-14]
MRPLPQEAAPSAPPQPAWGRLVLWGTALLTLLRLAYAGRVDLAPQEAYYWQYARHLDLSYFDHPPLSAWLIWASTRLLGSTERGVRLPALLCGAGLTLLVYHLGARLFSPRAGALAALGASCTVLFGLGAVVVTPDVPLALAWAAALCVLCELVLPDGKGPGPWGARWLLLGLCCGLAMLSKYTGALLLLQGLLTALWLPRGRAALRTPAPYLAAALALLVFSPVLVWNARHGWASFAFQSSGRLATVHGLQPHLLGRYVGLQALGVGPLLYLALWAAAPALLWRAVRGEARARLLALASLPGLLLFSAVSPLHWVKLNWVGPVYLGLMLAVAGAWDAGWARPRVRAGALACLATGALLTLGMYLMPLVPAVPFHERDNLVSGWRQLAAGVAAQQRPGEPAPLVIGWGYKTASELAFYLPGQPLTDSDGALGGAGLAYDGWQPQGAEPRTALVVADERQPLHDALARLQPHCARVEPLAPVDTFRGEHPVTRYQLWRCEGWRRAPGAVLPAGPVGPIVAHAPAP